jgi:hypothetical protein
MSELPGQTPVVLIIFNRPETTARVFEAIRRARPPQLWIIADGPRSDRPQDTATCAAARAIVDQVDWDCAVFKHYSDVNLGSRKRVATGLDWVFSQVEAAIILEDDCLPDATFFPFCEILLDRYRHDQRVMTISGDNFLFNRVSVPDSYYFSRYHHGWGWATWRRVWQQYDAAMQHWPTVKQSNWLDDILQNPRAVKHWHQVFQATYEEKVDAWDFVLMFSCFLQNGWHIHPDRNLVTNIGFHAEATHTKDWTSPYAALAAQAMAFPLQHPLFLLRHVSADRYIESTLFNETLPMRIKAKLRKTWRQLEIGQSLPNIM